MRKLLLFLIMFVIPMVYSYGIRIPLEGGTATHGAAEGTMRIGVVDIEMIFREFPETKRGQKELENELKKAQEQIEVKKKEIEELQKEIDEMDAVEEKTGNLPGMKLSRDATGQAGVDVSTSTGAALDVEARESGQEFLKDKKDTKKKEDQKGFEKLYKSKKELLQKKKDELGKFIKESEANLLAMEERRSREILEKLYRVLEKIAREESLDVILDKNYVLYGQPAIDVTEKLKKRLAGE